MVEIEGYKVAPLRLTADAQNCHQIYMREHFIRLMDPNKPKGRTLFLLNVPPYITEESLKRFFQKAVAGSKVVAVTFAAKPGREETQNWHALKAAEFCNTRAPFQFKVAYVVFKNTSSVAQALTVSSIDLFSKGTGESLIESGMQRWHSDYQQYILDEAATQKQIDEYMAEYDERERAEQAAAKNSEADADGWVTVGSQGRDAGFEQKKTVIERLEDKLAKDKRTKELTNFYTFQIRESKMKNIIELRKKFEDDKRKIELVKQTRRFKPF